MTESKVIKAGNISFDDAPDFRHDNYLEEKKYVNEWSLSLNNNPRDLYRQRNWIIHYNDSKKVFASAADYYRVFTQIKNNPDDIVNMLYSDTLNRELLTCHIITSTAIDHHQTESEIIHHYGSKVVNQVSIMTIKPIHMKLEKILETDTGLKFIQALFDTTNSKEEIYSILRYTLDRAWNKNIHVLIPDNPLKPSDIRPVSFTIDDRNILINTQICKSGYAHEVKHL